MNGQHDHPAPAENQQVKGCDKVMEPYRPWASFRAGKSRLAAAGLVILLQAGRQTRARALFRACDAQLVTREDIRANME